jgi:hypothetical protein
MTEAERPRIRDHLFVVRMWKDDADRPSARWRAQVTHVTSRERHYFTNYGELCEFIDRCREGAGGAPL